MKKLLLFSLSCLFIGSSWAQCNELFISEYCEGGGNNKGIEIYNPTDAPIDLSGYEILRYSNGSLTAAGGTLALTGTIASGGTHVVVNGQTTSTSTSPACDPAMQALADQLDGDYPAPMYMNGDDAITLEKNGVILDLFGKVGEDPGSAWTDDASAGFTDANGGTWWTRDQSLIRKPSVMGGVTTNPTLFDVTQQWDSLPKDTWDSLGSHVCDCQTVSVNQVVAPQEEIFFFPNPISNGKFVIKATAFISEVEIYDITGKTVYRETNDSYRGDVTVELSQSLKGIYLVKVAFENGRSSVRKIVIK